MAGREFAMDGPDLSLLRTEPRNLERARDEVIGMTTDVIPRMCSGRGG